jgi:hypothetical protein
MGLALARWAGWRVARLTGYVMPPLMALAVVVTANHYIVDGVLGALVALSGLGLAAGLSRWRRPLAVPLPVPVLAPPRAARSALGLRPHQVAELDGRVPPEPAAPPRTVMLPGQVSWHDEAAADIPDGGLPRQRGAPAQGPSEGCGPERRERPDSSAGRR